MKKTVYLLILLLNGYLAQGQSPVFHCLLFLDTDDFRLGSAIRITEGQLKGFAEKISRHTEMKSEITIVKGADLSVEKLHTTLNHLQAGEKDVIFFYFSGHGWNNSESEYPMLKMGGEGITLENSIGLEEIYTGLLEKKARMTLAFAEACNESKSFEQKISSGGEADHIIYNMSADKVRPLFRQTKANIIMSSSQRGQRSFSTPFGGYFTNTFCKTFEKMTAREYLEVPTWEGILEEIQEGTRQVSAGTQNPIFDLQPYEDQNSRVKKEGICALNMTAFHKIYEDYYFLEKYWKDVLRYDKDKAVEIYEMFFQVEVPEFYENLVNKLNLGSELPENERRWFSETARETVDYLKQIDRYRRDDAYRAKTFAKLPIPIDNLKLIYSKLDNLRKRCSE